MKLFGTITSPYVRRVRIILLDSGINFDWVDTSQETGLKELKSKTPLWKIPYMEISDNFSLWDSRTIIDYLIQNYKPKQIRAIQEEFKWKEECMIRAVDAALDSGINLFYLKKEGASVDQFPYLKKQESRIPSILHWVEKELNDLFWSQNKSMGISELAMYTALDWFQFRSVCDLSVFPGILAFMERWKDIPSIKKTHPEISISSQ
jgi:glutathione S-transferase